MLLAVPTADSLKHLLTYIALSSKKDTLRGADERSISPALSIWELASL